MSDNPYAPPETPLVLRPSAAAPAGTGWKWVYGALSGAILTGVALTHVLPWSSSTDVLWETIDLVDLPIDVARLLIGVGWLYTCWAELPAWTRGTVTPRRALAYFFIPAYNLVWQFLVHQRLCRAYDAALMSAARTPAAPTLLAALAPLLHLCAGLAPILQDPWVNLAFYAATATTWFAYMVRIDAVRAQVKVALMPLSS